MLEKEEEGEDNFNLTIAKERTKEGEVSHAAFSRIDTSVCLCVHM